jgi:PKD repeat protein
MRRVEVVLLISAASAGTLVTLGWEDSMRSIRLLAVTTTVLVLGSACGGDGPGGGEENQPPVADFTPPVGCVAGSACNFTSTGSTDDKAITTYIWDFDAAGTAPNGTTSAASFTFAAEGSYPVTLTVGDAEGLTATVTKNVAVAAAPAGNILPTANFTIISNPCTEDTPCGFSSTSTDPDGDIGLATFEWDFGDGTVPAPAGPEVTHTYEAANTYQVKLKVTDVAGGVAEVTLPITVQAQAVGQDCTTTPGNNTPGAGGTNPVVDCLLTVNTRSTITFTLVSEDCDFGGNRLEVDAPPVNADIFFNFCNLPAGTQKTVTIAAGSTTPQVFEAGSVLHVHFVRGPVELSDPPASDPGIQVDGSSPNWTLNIDDGGLAGAEGEPDFNDAVVSIVATPAP